MRLSCRLVAGDGRAVELQLELAVENESEVLFFVLPPWVARSFQQEVVGSAGFCGKQRKHPAETTELSGKRGINALTVLRPIAHAFFYLLQSFSHLPQFAFRFHGARSLGWLAHRPFRVNIMGVFTVLPLAALRAGRPM